MALNKTGRKFWGSHVWTSMHSMAAAYKPEHAGAFMRYIQSLTELLPCEKCCAHFSQTLKKYPIDNYLRSNLELFFWTYLVHDAVNQQINKETPNDPPKVSPDYEEIKSFYFRSLGADCSKCNLPAKKV